MSGAYAKSGLAASICKIGTRTNIPADGETVAVLSMLRQSEIAVPGSLEYDDPHKLTHRKPL